MNRPEQPTIELWTRRIAWAGALACLPLLLLDWPIHRDPDFHPHFALEGWHGFYCGVGLVTCAVLAAMAKLWRPIVNRAEDYYRD